MEQLIETGPKTEMTLLVKVCVQKFFFKHRNLIYSHALCNGRLEK